MLYEIAEHTDDRFVIRVYADEAGSAGHAVYAGVFYLAAALLFTVTAWRSVPWWVTALVIAVGVTLGVSSLVSSRRFYQRVYEWVYDFDKRRGTFEVRTRKLRGAPPVVESYPLAFVQGVTVDLEYDEGYEKYILIRVLEEKRVRFFWPSRHQVQAEQLMTMLNDFLGTSEPQP
jgi:hypothetical protein